MATFLVPESIQFVAARLQANEEDLLETAALPSMLNGLQKAERCGSVETPANLEREVGEGTMVGGVGELDLVWQAAAVAVHPMSTSQKFSNFLLLQGTVGCPVA